VAIPRSVSNAGYSSDVLTALAIGLAADSARSGRRALEVVRARSPELVSLSEDTGEDLAATSVGLIDILLMSLRSDIDLPWALYEQRARDDGRLRAAQGVPLESVIDMLAVYRRVTIELVAQPLEGGERRDEIVALAQGRLENVVERLTSSTARGYLDYLDAEHRAREAELYGLAAIVTAMARSLDVAEAAEVALVEALASLRLSAGAIWLRERATFKLVHSAGLDTDQIADFTSQAGPRAKAVVSANGKSESRVDRVVGRDWNAMRAQLRVKGRTVAVMSVGTTLERVFGVSDLLFMAALADQVAIALDRARQFSSEARTDHLTGLANRREFERVMEREVALAERHKRRLALMMIDLDSLKRINDRHGHRAGDEALRLVAQQVQRVVRASDICARLGGDEFAVAMPETDLGRAREVASRLRAAVENSSLSMKSLGAVQVSVGVAEWRFGQDWQATYQVADMDLYEDKRRSRPLRALGSDEREAPIQESFTARSLLRRRGSRRVAGG
jgi:diguanylate cyclase (GGDEF)-like protein